MTRRDAGYHGDMAFLRPRLGYRAAERGAAGRLAAARLVTTVASVIAAIIVLGILLKVAGANPANELVSAVTDAARALAGPFHDLFRVHGEWRYVVNWGIAALVYVLAGRLVGRMLLR